MIASSENIEGPYDSNPKNPILTSRHLSNNNWVHSTGHADLVQLKDGRWYMVSLGIRNEMDATSNMGRETHLMPVSWEEAWDNWVEVEEGRWEPVIIKWPVVAPKTGKIERFTPVPFIEKKQYVNNSFYDDFSSNTLDLQWNFRRVPRKNTYVLDSKNKKLKLNLSPETFKLRGQYSLMDDNYINFTIKKENKKTNLVLIVKPRESESRTIKSMPIKYNDEIVLKILSKNNKYTYHYSIDGGNSFMLFSETKANLVLCKGYIGTNLGLYATSNGNKTKEYAEFNWVKNQIK